MKCIMPEPIKDVPREWPEALYQAVSAIYFDDSSDYKMALLNIVKALAPEWVDELTENPKAVFDKARARIVEHHKNMENS